MATLLSRILERKDSFGQAGIIAVSLCLCAGLPLAGVLTVSTAEAVDFAGGVAFPRGFYDYAVYGYGEFSPYDGNLPPVLTIKARGSEYVSYRDGVGLLVTSGSLLLELSPPSDVSRLMGLRPYVSAGPSLNYLYSWADLGDFGSLSESEFSVTASVFAGVEFSVMSGLAFFAEARQTIQSDFTFDYVLVGIKLLGPRLPGTE
jgi:hypothetical protein